MPPGGQSWTPRVSAPSTTRLVPLVKLDTGLARKTTARAISCGRAHAAGRVEAERGGVELRVALLDLVPDAALEVRVAGRDHVGPNALAGELVAPARRCSGRAPPSSCRRGRRRSRPRGRETLRHRDDRPPAAGLQVRQRRLDQPDGAHEVDLEGGAPVLLAVRDGQRAHVGDDDVEAAEPLGRPADPAGQRRRRRPRRATGRRTGSPASASSVAAISAASRAQNATARALGDERLDDRPADAAGAAGDERAACR